MLTILAWLFVLWLTLLAGVWVTSALLSLGSYTRKSVICVILEPLKATLSANWLKSLAAPETHPVWAFTLAWFGFLAVLILLSRG